MAELTCSLGECRNEILGTGVLLSNLDGAEIDWDTSELETYIGDKNGLTTEWVILHPVCFTRLFDEMMRQNQTSVLMIAMGTVSDMRLALAI